MGEFMRWFGVVALASAVACGSVRPHESQGGDGGTPDGGVPDGSSTDGSNGGGTVNFHSCVGLPTTCGVDGKDDCCNSPSVPEGTYHRSFDAAGAPDSGNTGFPATVSDFRLDKYEISVGRFRQFLNAGLGTQASPPVVKSGEHPNLVGSGWNADWSSSLVMDKAALQAGLQCDPSLQTWTDQPGGNEDRPINCITWFEAMAFCVWDGGFLPTEAEWNYAAAGGDEQRAYPWSSPPGSLALDATYASYAEDANCIGDGVPDCTLADIYRVGARPNGDGRWGQSDLGGNIAEWTLDWAGTYPASCVDCANLAPAVKRTIRGGAFATDSDDLRTGSRLSFSPLNRSLFVGARCARASR